MCSQIGSVPKEFEAELFFVFTEWAIFYLKICLILSTRVILIVLKYIGPVLVFEALFDKVFFYLIYTLCATAFDIFLFSLFLNLGFPKYICIFELSEPLPQAKS